MLDAVEGDAVSEYYQVKGSSIRSKFDYVSEKFGEEAEAELRHKFGDEGASKFLDSGWYPFGVFDEILVWIAGRFFDGDIARLSEVGEFSAEKSLTGVYKIYLQQPTFDKFLERIATLHGQFYDQGEMVVEAEEGGSSCTIVLRGAPRYSMADTHVARGFYLGSARLFGLENPSCDFQIQSGQIQFNLSWA